MTNKKKKNFKEYKESFEYKNGGNNVYGRDFVDASGIIEFGKICSKTHPNAQKSVVEVCKKKKKDGELSLWIALDRYALVVNVTRGYYYVHGYGS